MDTIAKENLLSRVSEVGDDMISGLEDLASKYPGVFRNVRGKVHNLFLSFGERNKILNFLLRSGNILCRGL